VRLLLATLLLLAAPSVALARPQLEEAGRLLLDGRYAESEALVAPLTGDRSLLPAERAEAHRLHGLALFFLGRRAEAEAQLVAFLALEPGAHLDPNLYPPEAVVFLEDVRTRHAGKLRVPRPKRRSAALNLLPPLGQIQNGQPAKAWVIGVAEVTLLAVNVGTYAMLSSSCEADLTCDRDYDAARALRVVNLASGIALIGVFAYGVIDGYVGYGRAGDRERRLRLSVVPFPGGGAVGATASF
jgi:hypothetical protein